MKTAERLTMRDLWLDSARRSPDTTALIWGDQRLTYQSLIQRAKKLSSSLYAQGVLHQDRVSILSKNRTEFIEVCVACNTSGYIAAPINWRLAAAEVEFILNDSTPKVLFFEEEFAPLIDAVRGQASSITAYICLGENTPPWAQSYEALVEAGEDIDLPFQAAADDIAHLLYTSGTTGKPKGVMRSQAAEARGAESNAMALELNFGGRMLQMMPLFHIGALSIAHAQFFCEGTVVLHQQFDPVQALETIEAENISATLMAPTLINDLFNVEGFADYDLSSLKTICYSAAPMPTPLLKEGLERLGAVFVDCYGSTEAKVVTFLHKHRHLNFTDPEVEKKLGSVGQPTSGVKVRIVDDNGKPCVANQIGEICVSGPALMSGYWNNTQATIEAMQDGWFATGDMGYLDDEDYLFLVDRKKDMIISGGENIYCREVEEALMAHPALEDAAVIGVPDERWGESVRAIVILKRDSSATEEELITFCQGQIARYKCPKTIIFVDDFPRLPSGKTKKTALRERYSNA